MCQDSRNPALPLQTTLPLLTALNACLPPVARFDPRQSSCSVELLTSLLEQLPVVPDHVTTHRERGQCAHCGGQWEQVGALIPFLKVFIIFSVGP